jgi:hypothetical protein
VHYYELLDELAPKKIKHMTFSSVCWLFQNAP